MTAKNLEAKLSDAGVNLTDAEKDRVADLGGDTAAYKQVLSERVGPDAGVYQDYPDVFALAGQTEPEQVKAELPDGFVLDPRTGEPVPDTVEPKPEKVALSGKQPSTKDAKAAAEVNTEGVGVTGEVNL